LLSKAIKKHQNLFGFLHSSCKVTFNINPDALQVRRKMSNKDNYRPAGGKFNPFETPLKSAMEETFEETGVKVDIMKFRGC